MNITPINFLSFKSSSSIDKLGLSPEEKYPKADKNLVYVYDDRFGFKNSSSLIPTKRSEIILRREEIKAKINAIKKDRDTQVQDIRDYQQQLKKAADRVIASEEDKIVKIEMAARKQISDLELELMLLEHQL